MPRKAKVIRVYAGYVWMIIALVKCQSIRPQKQLYSISETVTKHVRGTPHDTWRNLDEPIQGRAESGERAGE